jgi:hypothetical protein
MARVIRLGDIGDYANTQMEKLLACCSAGN